MERNKRHSRTAVFSAKGVQIWLIELPTNDFKKNLFGEM